MSTSTKSYRNEKDHLTKSEFKEFKCSRCRKVYKRMAIDNRMFTCPPCLNGKDKDEISL